ADTLVDPPPDSLLLEDLPPVMGSLFESAFRANGNPRPTPQQWIEQLDQLLKMRRTCSTDKLHVYPGSAGECPWCRIEDRGGPSFFFPADAAATVSSNRLARLEVKILDLDEVKFPELTAERIAVPIMPPLKERKPIKGWGALDVATVLM